MTFCFQNNTPTIGRLAFYLPNALFFLMLMSSHPGVDEFINILLDDKGYDVTIGNFTECSCVYFVTMLASFLGGRGVYVQSKHVYHIL